MTVSNGWPNGRLHRRTQSRAYKSYINSSFRPKFIIRARRESIPPQTLPVGCVERCQRQWVELVMTGCSALAQTKYLARHNAVLKILYFELQYTYKVWPSWIHSALAFAKEPEPITENNSITAYWDVPVFAENTEVRANRIDARIVDKVRKEILLMEMSCP